MDERGQIGQSVWDARSVRLKPIFWLVLARERSNGNSGCGIFLKSELFSFGFVAR